MTFLSSDIKASDCQIKSFVKGNFTLKIEKVFYYFSDVIESC